MEERGLYLNCPQCSAEHLAKHSLIAWHHPRHLIKCPCGACLALFAERSRRRGEEQELYWRLEPIAYRCATMAQLKELKAGLRKEAAAFYKLIRATFAPHKLAGFMLSCRDLFIQISDWYGHGRYQKPKPETIESKSNEPDSNQT